MRDTNGRLALRRQFAAAHAGRASGAGLSPTRPGATRALWMPMSLCARRAELSIPLI